MCVYAPEAINKQWHDFDFFCYFQFQCIPLVIDAIDECGPSDEMRCQLQPKKTNVLAVYKTVYGTPHKKFTFRTVVNIHICVVHLTYLTLLLPRTYVLAGVRVVRVYRLKFLRSLAN